jgi:hypothetical protein
VGVGVAAAVQAGSIPGMQTGFVTVTVGGGCTGVQFTWQTLGSTIGGVGSITTGGGGGGGGGGLRK